MLNRSCPPLSLASAVLIAQQNRDAVQARLDKRPMYKVYYSRSLDTRKGPIYPIGSPHASKADALRVAFALNQVPGVGGCFFVKELA